MKKIVYTCILLFSIVLQAQYTLIPDPYFEGYLVNIGVDTDGEVNGQVLTSDIADETQLILTGNIFITDLTGIEDFESLEILDIWQMGITEIDLSHNIYLWRLDISDVSLESIDLSENVNLFAFYLALNNDSGMFTSPINSIDLSNNVLLNTLFMNGTLITEVDLINNININNLRIKYMEELTAVNLKNESNLDLGYLEIRDNLNLQCLQVDDPAAVIAGVTPPYDSWVFVNNPNLVITDDCSLGVEDNVLNSQVNIYPNPVENILNIENNSYFTITSIHIYDSLGRLIVSENNPTRQIDVSNLTSGLFLVKMETDRGIITKKIIKE